MRKDIFLAALAFAALSSCGNKGQQTASMDDIKMDSIVADSSASLTAEQGSPKCQVAVSLQYAKGKNADKINAAILGAGILAPDYSPTSGVAKEVKPTVDYFVKKYLEDYKRDYAPLYKDDRNNKQQYECRYRLTTSTLSNKKGILTYIATTNMYGGGMHEVKQTLAKNIDVATGKILTLDDIFIHGFEKKLTDVIVAKLAEKYKVEGLDGLTKKLVFADGQPYASSNFIVGDGKITFIYCEDEIAPHNFGEIRVDVDESDMEGLMK